MSGLAVCRESRALGVALPGAVRWAHRDLRAELQCRVQAKLGRCLHRHHCSPPVPPAVRVYPITLSGGAVRPAPIPQQDAVLFGGNGCGALSGSSCS